MAIDRREAGAPGNRVRVLVWEWGMTVCLLISHLIVPYIKRVLPSDHPATAMTSAAFPANIVRWTR
jgi:hypothetical protein